MTADKAITLADEITAEIQESAVLKALGLSPDAVESHALMLIARRYELDPLLGEVALIPSKGVIRPYVTRAGMLRIAHRSGFLDGIVTDELRRNSSGDGWTAYVSVWRKDCAHPFKMGAQCKDDERQSKEGYGPEQALARAMRRALVVAFAISTPDVDQADDVRYVNALPARELVAEGGDQGPTSEVQSARLPAPDPAAQTSARREVAGWTAAEKLDFMERFQITDLDGSWPAEAFTFALEAPF